MLDSNVLHGTYMKKWARKKGYQSWQSYKRYNIKNHYFIMVDSHFDFFKIEIEKWMRKKRKLGSV